MFEVGRSTFDVQSFCPPYLGPMSFDVRSWTHCPPKL